MKKICFLLTATFALVLSLSFVTQAKAQDVIEQWSEQTQTSGDVCIYNSYYQTNVCTPGGSQTQKIHQLISYARPRVQYVKVHVPVDTAADPAVVLGVFATGLIGIGAFAGYLRIK